MDKRGDFAANKRFLRISLMAIFIGIICTFIAKGLLLLIYFFTNLFYFQSLSLEFKSPSENHLGIISIFIPALGGLIIGLMARLGSERIRGHGIPEALEAILFGKSKMSPKVAVLKPLSSAISIGSGGPFGAEGPIIMTGGAFGSIIAQSFHLTASERKTLLVAGAAAGMSAIFASPVAAVLLSVELLLFEWKPRSLIPVALASAVAGVLRTTLFGNGPLFAASSPPIITIQIVLAAALIGLAAGILSTALSWLVYKFEDLFLKLSIHWMWWPIMGGFVIGVGGYFQPRALGVGYDVIADLLNGKIDPHAVVLLILVKCFIWSLALGSGTSGGVLAPLLIIGGGLGSLMNPVLPSVSSSFWPLLSMAAVLGGMMRSPFTGAIFALELTGDFNALLPLLVAAVIGHAFTVLVMKRSILTEKVARRGFHVFREYSVDILERVYCDQIMTTQIESIPAHMAVSEVMTNFFGQKQNHLAYPVVDSNLHFLGIVTRDELLKKMNEPQIEIGTILPDKFIFALPKDSCRELTERMAQNNLLRLPIVDPLDHRKLLGIVTLSDLLKPRLSEIEEEQVRERPLLVGEL